jgi:hypothetical protein
MLSVAVFFDAFSTPVRKRRKAKSYLLDNLCVTNALIFEEIKNAVIY